MLARSPTQAFLLQQNLGVLPKAIGFPKGTRLLRLLHLKTRSVCESRMAEWKQGVRWGLREDHEGALNGVSFVCATPLDKKGVRTLSEPCVGACDEAKTKARWAAERERREAEEARAEAEALAKARAQRAAASAGGGRSKGGKNGKKRAAPDAALSAAGPTPPATSSSAAAAAAKGGESATATPIEVTEPVPYAAWPPERKNDTPTSSHDRSKPKTTAYDERKQNAIEAKRRADLCATIIEERKARAKLDAIDRKCAEVRAEYQAKIDHKKLEAVHIIRLEIERLKGLGDKAPEGLLELELLGLSKATAAADEVRARQAAAAMHDDKRVCRSEAEAAARAIYEAELKRLEAEAAARVIYEAELKQLEAEAAKDEVVSSSDEESDEESDSELLT